MYLIVIVRGQSANNVLFQCPWFPPDPVHGVPGEGGENEQSSGTQPARPGQRVSFRSWKAPRNRGMQKGMSYKNIRVLD